MGQLADAALNAARGVSILLSLDLTNHPDTQARLAYLAYLWEQGGHTEGSVRLRRGDISDLVPGIEQIEAEHRAWVAEDPKKRRFGPRSPITGAYK